MLGLVRKASGFRKARKKTLGREISGECAVILCPPGLCDDLNHTAICLAVFRFEGSGFNLNLLHKGQIDAASQRSIVIAPDTYPSKSSVVDTHAIRDVVIFQPSCTTDGWICCTGATAIDCSGRGIEQTAHVASSWNLLVKR